MNVLLKLKLALILILASQSFVFSQKEEPKFGLCLSGGGARGLAHIGLLEIIDSLGIKVDYITGTSTGSVIGALYSVGYSGKDIRRIVEKEIDWAKLFSRQTEYSKINIEEKDEYQNSIVSLNLDKRKVSLPIGMIEGQELQKALIKYLYPSLNIHNFDNLPIPFRCIAVDIYTGKKVVLKDGNLTKAVRASMAIPLVFTPVKKDSMLLVDGGLLKNMPVDELIDMGAEFIIGSYTGFTMKGKQDLTSGLKLLLQTQSVLLVEKSMSQAKKSDILVYNPLDGYSAGDFADSKTIIKIGKNNAYKHIDQLINAAELQKKSSPRLSKKNILNIPFNQKIHFDSIHVIRENNMSDSEVEFALREFKFDTSKTYDLPQIFKRVNRVYGTRFFSKTFFDIDNHSGSKTLTLNLKSSPHSTLGVAPRYETENGAAIGLNYSLRNKALKNSRLTFDLNLGDNLAGRLKYIKYIFKTNFIWFDFKALYEKSNLTDFTNFGNSSVLAFTRNYFLLDAGVNFSFGRNLYLGVHATAPYSIIKSKITANKSQPLQNIINLDKFTTAYKSVKFKLNYNTLDHKYFPTTGWKIKTSLDFQFDVENSINLSLLDENSIDGYLNINDNLKTPFVTNINLDIQKYFTVFNRLTINLQFNANISADEIQKPSDTVYNQLRYDNKFVGGLLPREDGGYVNFYGLRQAKGFFSDHALVSGGAKLRLFDKLYLSGYLNSGLFYDGEFKELSGGAIGVEYNSIIGPIKMYLEESFDVNQRFFYLSIGYPF